MGLTSQFTYSRGFRFSRKVVSAAGRESCYAQPALCFQVYEWACVSPTRYLKSPTVIPPTVGGKSVTSKLDFQFNCRDQVAQEMSSTGTWRKANFLMSRMASLKTTTPAPEARPIIHATSKTVASGSSFDCSCPDDLEAAREQGHV